MNHSELTNALEELMEMDEGSLSVDTELATLDDWDSVATMGLIVMMDKKFNKALDFEQIKKFKTVGDIIKFSGVEN